MQVVEDRQRLYGSFGNAFSLAVEFVAVPFIFAGIGHLFDRRLGTGSVFALVLFTFGVIGMFVRTWYSYDEAMTAAEAESPWRRERVTGGEQADGGRS